MTKLQVFAVAVGLSIMLGVSVAIADFTLKWLVPLYPPPPPIMERPA